MHVMKIPGLDDVIRGTSIIILVSGLSRTHEAWLTHNLMFRPLAIRSVFSITIGGVIGIILAYKGYGVASLVTQQVITSLIAAVTLWIATPWKPSFKFSKSSVKEIANYSKHVSLGAVTNFTNQYSDIFFVSFFLGAAQTGVYSTGKRIVNTLNTVLSSALMRVSLPAFSRVKNDKPKFKVHYLNATFLTILITAPAFLGLCYLSEDIVRLLLGVKWIESVPVMQIVSLVGFVTSIGYYNHSVMFACDKPDWQAKLTLLYAISNVIVFYIFVRYGLVVTAWAFSIRTVALYPVSAWCALTLLDVTWSEYVKQLYIPILSSSAMCLVMWFFDHQIAHFTGWLKVSVDIFIGCLAYIIFTKYCMPKTQKEVLSSVYKSIRNKD
ncbi:lipopolysaccharide biosynthesis protein [Sodalis sp. RH13]